MKIYAGAFLLAVTAALVSTQRACADPILGNPDVPYSDSSWNGFFISTSVGYGWSDSSQSIDINGETSDRSSFNADGAIGAVGLGYDLTLNRNFVVGVFGDYTFGDLKDHYSLLGLGLTGSYGNIWAVGGRAGYLVYPGTLLFGTGGYTNADLKLGSEDGSETHNLDGYFVGGGFEQRLSEHLFFKTEYRFSDYQDFSLSGSCGECTLSSKVDSDVHSIRFGIVLKFGEDFIGNAVAN